MDEIITKDASITFFNDTAKDFYHSLQGAREEAFVKYASHLTGMKNPVIFDMFFGLGYNSAAALDVLDACTIHCFENDKEILKKVATIHANFKSFSTIQQFAQLCIDKKDDEKKDYAFIQDNKHLIMHFGDARETIKYVEAYADIVFFDPFSPSKVPELWTEEFFVDIKKKMKKHSFLCTYSCASWIRKNMKNAGFVVENGPIFGRRGPSTIARVID